MDAENLINKIEEKNMGIKTITISAVDRIIVNGLPFNTRKIEINANAKKLAIFHWDYSSDIPEKFFKLEDITSIELQAKDYSIGANEKLVTFFQFP